jgi:predicted HTH domain antitoxin
MAKAFAQLLATASGTVYVDPMELTLPKPLDERISVREAALHLAIGLFVSEEATLGQAARTAGLSQGEFLRELGRRGIAQHYGEEELAEDLRQVEALQGR